MGDYERALPEVLKRLDKIDERLEYLEKSSSRLKTVDLMKRGATEVETLNLNGWGIGTILEGKDICGELDRIIITAIGESEFLCKWDHGIIGVFGKESGNATLTLREWREVKKGGTTT